GRGVNHRLVTGVLHVNQSPPAQAAVTRLARPAGKQATMEFRDRFLIAIPATFAAVMASIGVVLAALAFPGGTSVPAGAASSPGWRIAQVFGAPDFPNLQGLATTGPANAWMAGGDAFSLVVKRWDGTQWQPVTPPPGFADTTASINCGVVGTSGPGNTWLFPSRDSTYYALRWDGSAWTKFRLSSTNQVLG